MKLAVKEHGKRNSVFAELTDRKFDLTTDVLVQRETDIVHLRVRECLAFGKEVFLRGGEGQPLF